LIGGNHARATGAHALSYRREWTQALIPNL
jgi:hypothetical protein